MSNHSSSHHNQQQQQQVQSRGSNSPLLNLTTAVARGVRNSRSPAGAGGRNHLLDWPQQPSSQSDNSSPDDDQMQHTQQQQQHSSLFVPDAQGGRRSNGTGTGTSSFHSVVSLPVSPEVRSPHHSAAGLAGGTGSGTAKADATAQQAALDGEEMMIAAFGKLPRRASQQPGRSSAPHSRRNSFSDLGPIADFGRGPGGGGGSGRSTANSSTCNSTAPSSPSPVPRTSPVPSLRGWAVAAAAASPRLKEMEAQATTTAAAVATASGRGHSSSNSSSSNGYGRMEHSPRLHTPTGFVSLGMATSNSRAGRIGRLLLFVSLVVLCLIGAVLYRVDITMQDQLRDKHIGGVPVTSTSSATSSASMDSSAAARARVAAASNNPPASTPPVATASEHDSDDAGGLVIVPPHPEPPVLTLPPRIDLDIDQLALHNAAAKANENPPDKDTDANEDKAQAKPLPDAKSDKTAAATKDGAGETPSAPAKPKPAEPLDTESHLPAPSKADEPAEVASKVADKATTEHAVEVIDETPTTAAAVAVAPEESTSSTEVALADISLDHLDADAAASYRAAWKHYDSAVEALLSPDPSTLIQVPELWYDSMYKTFSQLRASQERQIVDEALQLLEQRWRDSLTPAERERERRFWAAQHRRHGDDGGDDGEEGSPSSPAAKEGEHFERAERYLLEQTTLLPEISSPPSSMANITPVDDQSSAGRALTISGRYFGDRQLHAEINPDDRSNFSFHYELCSFEHVCLSEDNPQSLYFHARNVTAYLRMEVALARCSGGRLAHLGFAPPDPDASAERLHAKVELPQRTLCNCFHGAFVPRMRPYEWSLPSGGPAEKLIQEVLKTNPKTEEEYAALLKRIDALPAEAQLPPSHSKRQYPDPTTHMVDAARGRDHSHYWAVNKWVTHHHLAHWAQKLLMWQSIMQHAHVFYEPAVSLQSDVVHPASEDERSHRLFDDPLPPFTGMVFQDSDARTSEHEEAVLALSMRAALGPESAAHAGHVGSRTHKSPLPSPAFLERKHWFDDSGMLIWSDDIKAGKYATSLPPAPKGAPISRGWEGMDRGISAPKRSEEEVAASGGPLFTCFKRLTYTPSYGELSLHPKDSLRWRALMRRSFAQRQQLHQMRHQRLAQAQAQLQLASPDAVLAAKSLSVSLGKQLMAGGVPLVSPAEAARVQLAEDSGFGGAGGCPPRRISVIWRGNRHLLIDNAKMLLDRLAKKFNLSWFDEREFIVRPEGPNLNDMYEKAVVEEETKHKYTPPPRPRPDQLVQLQYTSVGAKTSSLEQQALFLSSGLVISPHSSQLVNVLFSPRSAALMEVTPEFHNNDFARYAVGMGLENFQYMLGGCALEGDPSGTWNGGIVEDSPAVNACVRDLNARCAEGVGLCVLKDASVPGDSCPLGLRSQNKYLNFRVTDLDLFERVLERAIEGIEQRCAQAAQRAGIENVGWIKGFQQEREEFARKHHKATQQQKQQKQEKKKGGRGV